MPCSTACPLSETAQGAVGAGTGATWNKIAGSPHGGWHRDRPGAGGRSPGDCGGGAECARRVSRVWRAIPRRAVLSADAAPPCTREATTLIAVVTDYPCDHGVLTRLCVAAHDGLARMVRPAHTMFDGDTAFAIDLGGRGCRPRRNGCVWALPVELAVEAAIMQGGSAGECYTRRLIPAGRILPASGRRCFRASSLPSPAKWSQWATDDCHRGLPNGVGSLANAFSARSRPSVLCTRYRSCGRAGCHRPRIQPCPDTDVIRIRSVWVPDRIEGWLAAKRMGRLTAFLTSGSRVDGVAHDRPAAIGRIGAGSTIGADLRKHLTRQRRTSVRFALGIRGSRIHRGHDQLVQLTALRHMAEEWDLDLALDLSGDVPHYLEAEAAVLRLLPRLTMVRIPTWVSRTGELSTDDPISRRVVAILADQGYCGRDQHHPVATAVPTTILINCTDRQRRVDAVHDPGPVRPATQRRPVGSVHLPRAVPGTPLRQALHRHETLPDSPRGIVARAT